MAKRIEEINKTTIPIKTSGDIMSSTQMLIMASNTVTITTTILTIDLPNNTITTIKTIKDIMKITIIDIQSMSIIEMKEDIQLIGNVNGPLKNQEIPDYLAIKCLINPEKIWESILEKSEKMLRNIFG